MDVAIRNTESKLNTRLTDIRRSYKNMLLSGGTKVKKKSKKKKRGASKRQKKKRRLPPLWSSNVRLAERYIKFSLMDSPQDVDTLILGLADEWEKRNRGSKVEVDDEDPDSFNRFVETRLAESERQKKKRFLETRLGDIALAKALQLWTTWHKGINDAYEDLDDALMRVYQIHMDQFPDVQKIIKLAHIRISEAPEKVHGILKRFDKLLNSWAKLYMNGENTDIIMKYLYLK